MATHPNHITAVSEIDLRSRWEPWAEDGLPNSLTARLAPWLIYNDADLATLENLATELDQLLEHHHPLSAVDRFLCIARTHSESCDRRAALRLLERLSQLNAAPLPWTGLPHPDLNARRRPLTGLERGLVRHCALTSPARTGVVGLIDSGATSGELGDLRATAFTNPGNGVVAARLPGTCRGTRSGYPEAQPRTVEIAAWARPALTRLVAGSDHRPVLYSGQAEDPAKVQSALLMAVGHVLRDAGLAGDPAVQPMSIRNTFGRAHYDTTGDLVATAAALGHDDLMTVAREIGIREHRPVGTRRSTAHLTRNPSGPTASP